LSPTRAPCEAFYSARDDPQTFYDFVGMRPRLVRELSSLCGGLAS